MYAGTQTQVQGSMTPQSLFLNESVFPLLKLCGFPGSPLWLVA